MRQPDNLRKPLSPVQCVQPRKGRAILLGEELHLIVRRLQINAEGLKEGWGFLGGSD